jgi:hypothetical protein
MRPDEYTLDELDSMPTLAVGQADDLKLDDGNERVWLSRMNTEDGMPYNHQVTLERLIDGCWTTAETWAAE